MATEFSAIDLVAGSVTVHTTEIAIEKRGGIVAPCDTLTHRIRVTVKDGRNGWQDVAAYDECTGQRMDFGFILRDPQTGKPRWSYDKRPHQLIADARKLVRVAQKAARDAAAATREPVEVAVTVAPRSEPAATERPATAAPRETRTAEPQELVDAKRIIAAHEAADARRANALNAADREFRADGERPGWRENPDHAGYDAAVATINERSRIDRDEIATLETSLEMHYGQAVEMRNAYSRAAARGQIEFIEAMSYGDGE